MNRSETPPSPGRDLVAELQAIHAASYAWARACAGDPTDAADILQTAYEKILDGRARFDGRSAVKTWLFGVIRLTALEHRRRAWIRVLGIGRFGQEPAAAAPSADGAAETSEAARAVVGALARLPARQREVLHLVFYEGLTVDAAAAVMRVGVGSARVHYDRGKKRLVALLEEKGIGR